MNHLGIVWMPRAGDGFCGKTSQTTFFPLQMDSRNNNASHNSTQFKMCLTKTEDSIIGASHNQFKTSGEKQERQRKSSLQFTFSVVPAPKSETFLSTAEV